MPKCSPQIFSLVSLLGVAILFSNCGDGGKARYEIEPISEATAIELLDNAQSDPKKTARVLERVRTSRRGDFDFKKFWSGVKDRDVLKRLRPDQQEKLLALHDETCQDTDLEEFVGLVLGLRRYEYIVGEFRKCQTALEPQRTRDLVIRLMNEVPREDLAPRPRRRITTTRSEQLRQKYQAQRPVEQMQAEDLPADIDQTWESWFARQEAQAPAEAPKGTENPDEKESLVSSLLLREILRSPDANWEETTCYLSTEDFALLESGLRAHGKAELADRLRAGLSSNCYF